MIVTRNRPRMAAARCTVSLAAVLLAALVVAPPAATAQDYRISQRGSVSQKLGATKVSLDYSRPLARGRADLFGGVVHWGELWTPGANEATVLEVSDTITLNGHTVPTGSWSMWIIPSQVGPWELVLDSRDSLFHTQRPELKEDQVRVPLEVKLDAPHEEALSWTFPRIAQDGATLRLKWATMQTDLEVGVKSIQPVITVAAEESARYVGKWRLTFVPPSEGGRPTPPPVVATLSYSDSGIMRMTFPPGAFGEPPPPPKVDADAEAKLTPQERERAEAKRKLATFEVEEFSYVLVPRAQGVFVAGWLQDGALYDVGWWFHEFEFEGSRAVRLTMRDDEDVVMATAVRAK